MKPRCRMQTQLDRTMLGNDRTITFNRQTYEKDSDTNIGP